MGKKIITQRLRRSGGREGKRIRAENEIGKVVVGFYSTLLIKCIGIFVAIAT
jgi:hypothetical protein